MEMENKVVYTAILGDYDILNEPTIVSEGWDYWCFTDQPLKSDVWKIIHTGYDGDPQRTARKIKILFDKFVPHNYSLWVDASFHIKCDLNQFWMDHYSEPFSVPSHPIRDCVFREIDSCLANHRGNEDELLQQRHQYKTEGVPAFNGIITSGVMMRKNCDFIKDFCADWYDELTKNSVRDQIAFAYVAWKWKWNYHSYKWDYSKSNDLKYFKHKKYK